MARGACVHVRVTVRRVVRHPLTQKAVRSGTLLRRHVVRGATLSIVPDALNEYAFHHAQLNMDEVFHVVQDTAVIGSMTGILAAVLVATRYGSE